MKTWNQALLTRFSFSSGTLILSSALCAAMLLVRAIAYGDLAYWFLAWNLALAWIPLMAASGAAMAVQRGARIGWLIAAPLLLIWVVFLPNAPYLITDMVHWRPQSNWQGWFELLMFMTFAWTGCLLGIASVRLLQEVVIARLGALAGWLLVLLASAASGIGVYVGRFLRFNSWDLASASGDDVVMQTLGLLLHPRRNALPLAFSATLAVFFLVVYTTMFAIGARNRSTAT